MNEIFVDSSFWVALTEKSDGHFEAAQSFFLSEEVQSKSRLVTTNSILWETLTRLRYRSSFKSAKEFGEKIRHSQVVGIVWMDEQMDKDAWKIFLKYADKDLSFVDCLSFACMKERNIKQALTFDRHFQQVGFTMLPERD